ncbi:MAG: patatin-like protein [Sphingomonas sp.]
MREKELRIALVCYGGISLAVYMHGVTKEIWRLARASRAFHAETPDPAMVGSGYHRLLGKIADEADVQIRVLVDILAGASAGGINAVFLSHAIVTGQPLDPLTDLWLESADVDELLDSESGFVSRVAKSVAVPFAWMLSRRSGAIAATVDEEQRDEIRGKLANFVRSRWLSPPFGGPRFTHLLLDAFEAMAKAPPGEPLLPVYQPLDLFVTVTDFRGHPQRLQLNSPPEVVEREHRVTLSFQDKGDDNLPFADPIELTFAARATASFPGAFPPFAVGELDKVLAERGRKWPGRDTFLARALPGRAAAGDYDDAILIDGSVLANAPFRPCIAALSRRPARREVDRRFIYIDPKPGRRSVNLGGGNADEPPGFVATVIGALSDIPREQPIRDNLETIDRLSSRIRRQRRIIRAMRPEVEEAIEDALGTAFFFLSPTAKRLGAWRSKANNLAAKAAGYAYAAYAHLKLATVAEDAASMIFRLSGGGDKTRRDRVRRAIWRAMAEAGLTAPEAVKADGLGDEVIAFLRDFDMAFRTRRLRFVVRHLTHLSETMEGSDEERDRVRALLNEMLVHYHMREPRSTDANTRQAFEHVEEAPQPALDALASLLDLRPLDRETDEHLAAALETLDKADRRSLLLNYLGYPFYDVATLPLLQGEGLDEFDPIKVDRISPDDAVAIRKGGTTATLKGIQFNSFGAFFSRAYRENDYLWGRLHGADRLIDIVITALPDDITLDPQWIRALKRDTFRAILAEERGRLKAVPDLFEQLMREIG